MGEVVLAQEGRCGRQVCLKPSFQRPCRLRFPEAPDRRLLPSVFKTARCLCELKLIAMLVVLLQENPLQVAQTPSRLEFSGHDAGGEQGGVK